LVLSVLVLALLAPSATAQASERVPLAVYCSPTGDLCQGVYRYNGRIKFSLGLFARYFNRVDVCVRDPSGRRTCRGVRVKKNGPLFEARIALAGNFPASKRGKYKVVWQRNGYRIGRALYFRKG
jgi:hypothetical protein